MIAYYFPPMGGSGVQRPLKFAKYLKELGWDPIVVAPEPGLYHTFDQSLLSELKESEIRVERVKNRSVFKSRKKLKKPPANNRWIASLLRWITTWFFLPDNKIGWIDEAVNKCEQIINKEAIQIVFSTAPPYSNLIAAKKIKDRTGIPVVMDLRDDWLESHLIRYPTKWHFKRMKDIEQKTLLEADHITVVNKYYRKKIMNRLGENSPGITTIPNGYDRKNFEKVIPGGDPQSFSILYSGLFYGNRKPDWFLKSVRMVMDRNQEFHDFIDLQFQGGLDHEHWKIINQLGLTAVVTDFGYVEHQDAVQNIVNADLLFLTLGERDHIEAVTPGKVFEYMGSLKPIIGYLPEGITRDLLNEYGAARCVGIRDTEKGAALLEDLFDLWKRDEMPAGDPDFIQQFERFTTATVLSDILGRLCEENS